MTKFSGSESSQIKCVRFTAWCSAPVLLAICRVLLLSFHLVVSGSNSLNEKSIRNQHKSSGLLTYFPQPRLKMWILSKNLEINALGSYQLLDNQTTSLRLCMCIIHCIAAGKSSLKIHRGKWPIHETLKGTWEQSGQRDASHRAHIQS